MEWSGNGNGNRLTVDEPNLTDVERQRALPFVDRSVGFTWTVARVVGKAMPGGAMLLMVAAIDVGIITPDLDREKKTNHKSK